MKKNIRKKGVEDIHEIEEVLKKENPEYYQILQNVKKSVGNDWSVVIFWNALATTELISSKQNIGSTLSALGIGTAAGIVMSYLTNQALGVAGLVGGFASLDLSLFGYAFNGPTNMDEKYKKQLELESLKVMYPDLYDLELVFNQADLEAVKKSIQETGYDGKQIYIEANKKWKEYLENNKYTRPDKLDKKANEFIEYPDAPQPGE